MDDKEFQQLRLSELRLFQGICSAEVKNFIVVTGTVIKTYTKNTRILVPYEANPNIGVMVKGQAQVIAEDCFGHESIGHTVERGALVGGIAAILPDTQFVNNMALEALTDVMVMVDSLSVYFRYCCKAGAHAWYSHEKSSGDIL